MIRKHLLTPSIMVCLLLGLPLNVVQAGESDKIAPSPLPHVTPSMLSAGFWISRHPSVDQLVMSSQQIKDFNRNIQDHLKLTKNIFTLIENFQTESLMDTFQKDVETFEKGYYTINGARDNQEFLETVKKNMRLRSVVLGIAPRYGVVVHYANQRFLPTEKGLYKQKGDVDFDELQNSALDVGEPVAIVHESLDKKWVYVFSSLSDGWVQADNILLNDLGVVKKFSSPEDFVVIVSPKADLFLDPQMLQYHDFKKMGGKLPLLEEKEDQWIVQLLLKDKQGKVQLSKGYIPRSQAHRGYLPYTARTILNQAFLMLDKPYGWGDMYGQQDCSRFLQMVYATVGIELPRDSKNQAQVGTVVASFDEKTANQEKLNALKNAKGGLSILSMKGHIMLYLGVVEGVPFVMQESSGYSQTRGEMQIKYNIMRAVVSDLSLGESSSKGSLLKRLLKVVGIQ